MKPLGDRPDEPDEKIEADLLAEELLGKPKPAATTSAGIAQMEERIAYLEKLLANQPSGEASKPNAESSASLNRDLATARQRLADYRAQQSARN